MLQFKTLSVFLCVMGLLSETLSSVTLETEAGDNVTIWCHDMADIGHVLWYKNTIDSVPLLLGCKQVKISGQTETCYFFSESERIVMSVHGSKTSLTITAVNVSDTGLYYCSFIEQVRMIFSTSTYLQVKDGHKSLPKNPERVSPAVVFMLIVVFGAVIVFLLGALIFIILKHRKTHRGAEVEEYKDPDSDSDLHLSKEKTNRRHDEMEYSYVVFSSVSQ
ncbi:hypothetical protein KOW79_018406 [Hemibagrus wyckioides]|uniref:Ig-like domain-containing protein n=1 Tax=Hemibagrus wyckioides TaxID=337641 RepID=A0A9D3SBR5_9TELE|nr:uncharacterized protein LOC131343605 [Hemibagrus wyckioides]KAG7318651.1 hypothetical protein KOW79_018406 [Hemibagrus wyckioides]